MNVFAVTHREQGQTLAAVVRGRLGMTWSAVKTLIGQGRVRVGTAVQTDVALRLKAGQRVEIVPLPTAKPAKPVRRKAPQTPPPKVPNLAESAEPLPQLVYCDEALVVVDKPPGLTTMRHAEEAAEFGPRGRHYLPPTLADVLARLVPGRPVRAVHRIDRDTSGLVVFARTSEAETHLGQQFRTHTIERRYRALVRGRPTMGRVESLLVRDRGDGRRGSGEADDPTAQRAVTQVQLLEELGPFALIECRLETGRTHQVRIHLGEMGCPLCGERVYDRPPHGAPLPDESDAPRMALHAATLGLTHPTTGTRLRWECPWPADLQAVLERLRRVHSAG